MIGLEYFLAGACCILSIGLFTIILWYRDLARKYDLQDELIVSQNLQDELIDSQNRMLDTVKEKNAMLTKQLFELERKAKLSGDVLAVLADMKAGGAVLEVTRVDRNDIFFHNGGAYR